MARNGKANWIEKVGDQYVVHCMVASVVDGVPECKPETRLLDPALAKEMSQLLEKIDGAETKALSLDTPLSLMEGSQTFKNISKTLKGKRSS
jgi:hypothetical protein